MRRGQVTRSSGGSCPGSRGSCRRSGSRRARWFACGHRCPVLQLSGACRDTYVDAYPPREYGSEVLRRESFLAADGPIAAGAAARLGLSVVLSTNGVADDSAGRHVLRTLRTWGVRLAAPDIRRTVTPASVVVCDSAGGRTFFPHLPGVLQELAGADLSGVHRARAVYVDCYEILGDSSKRILRECGDEQLVLANLGGSPPPSWLAARELGNQVSVVQTSVADGDVERARLVARDLREFTGAEVAVVTAGSGGAVLAAGAEHGRCRPARSASAAPGSGLGVLRRLPGPLVGDRRSPGGGSVLRLRHGQLVVFTSPVLPATDRRRGARVPGGGSPVTHGCG